MQVKIQKLYRLKWSPGGSKDQWSQIPIHFEEELDPDSHKKLEVRIRIKVMRIRNPVLLLNISQKQRFASLLC